MNKFHFRAFFWALCALAPSVALAQPSEEEELALVYGDKDTVSLATGSKESLRRAPSVATVITAEDIKTMGAKDLDDVMEAVPGVHVTRSANSYFSIYTIRGIDNSQTTNPQVLMLQNGIPTNSIYRGDRGQSIGPPLLENVERIEIIRGPGSALYGADAFAGVVNIITKTAATAPGTLVGGRIGSFNTQNAWVQHGSQHGPFDVEAYVQVGHTAGSSQIITADAATRLNAIFHNQSSLAPGPLNTGANVIDGQFDVGYDKWRWRTGYKWRQEGDGAGVSFALDPQGWERTQHINTDLSWRDDQFTRNWGVSVTANYLQHIEDNSYQMFPPGTKFPAVPGADLPASVSNLLTLYGITTSNVFPNGMQGMPGRWERQFRLSANASYSGFADHSIRLGAGHEDLNLYQVRTVKNFWLANTAATPAPLIGIPVYTGALIDYSAIQPHLLPHRRFNDYVYAQDEWNFARDWTLTAGVRNDNFSDFGSTTNPRLALVWDATVDLTAKALYGEAFRAPSVNEQYGVNPTGGGNPNVKPEHLKMMEAAFSWQAKKNLQLNLNLFHYMMWDAILPVAQPGQVGSVFTNTGQFHSTGGEFETVWDPKSNIHVTANLSLQETINESTNTDDGYTPRKHGFARADWRMADKWMLSPQLDWVADRRRVPGDTRPPVPDYTTFDVTLHNSQGMGKLDISATARNLFNATALEPTLYLAAPGPVPNYPTSAIPSDLPVYPRSIWIQATFRP